MDFFGICDFANSRCAARTNTRDITTLTRQPMPALECDFPSLHQANIHSGSQPHMYVDKNLTVIETETVLSGASTPPGASLDSQSVSNKQSHVDSRLKAAVLNPFLAKYQHHVPSSDHRKYSVLFAKDRNAYIEADLAIKGDRHLSAIAIGKFPELFAHAPHRIKNDVQIASKAVRALPFNVSFVGSEVKSDPAFWQAVSRTAGDGRQ